MLALHIAARPFAAQIADSSFLRLRARVAERRALEQRRQERRRPVVDPAVSERRTDRDEPWQVLVLAAEAVQRPTPDARPDERVAAGVDLQQRAAVRVIAAVEALQEADAVDAARDVWEQ